MDTWPILLEDFTIALVLLGFCGLSRWFYLIFGSFVFVVVAIACAFGSSDYLIRANMYELSLMGVLVGIYFILWLRARTRIVCFPAIVSICCAVFNPSVVLVLFRAAGMSSIVRGDSEIRSFAVGLIAVIAGYIGLRRIKKAERPLQGRFLAWVGLILGCLWVIGWTLLFCGFAWGMSHWQ